MRLSVAMAVACLTVAGLYAAEDVHAAIKKQTNIAAQGLGPALQSLAKDHDFQILYRSELVGDIRTGGAVGELTIDQALTQLLTGTDLKYQFLDDKTITILSADPSVPSTPTAQGARPARAEPAQDTVQQEFEARPSAQASGGESIWRRFRLAQENTPSRTESSSRSETTRTTANTASGEESMGEIIVTSQKRGEERLRDVPISISVLSGDDLDRASVKGVVDALRVVPGVSVVGQQAQGGASLLSVRGAANPPTFAGASPVAYYIDSIPFGFVRHAVVPDANAYDLERVEVLRGPQGTLYGAGGAAGVVRVLTKDPNLGDFEFKARTLASTTEDSDGASYRGDLAINLPIVDDKLAVRATAGYNKLTGWVDGPSKEDIDDGELTNIRFKLKAEPTENLDVVLFSWLSESDFDALALSDDNGAFISDLGQPTSLDFTAHGATISGQFRGFTVTSATSYIDYSGSSTQDLAWLLGNGVSITGDTGSRLLSEEVLLNSTSDGPWEWSLGALYRDAEDTVHQVRATPSATTTITHFQDTSESFATFGELHRRFLSDQLKLTVGLRYFHDDNAMKDRLSPLERTTTYEALTPRAVVTWFPSRDLTVYASYAQGFRSGLDQNPPTIAAHPTIPTAEPDKLHNYEIGAKANLLDQRVAFDFALYYADWKDRQQNVTVPLPATGTFGPAVLNVSSASGLGLEAAVSTRPVQGMTLGATFGWNDLTIDSDVISGGRVLFAKGDRTLFSPEYTAGGFGEYVFPIGGSGFKGGLSASLNYTSSQRASTAFSGIVEGDSILVGGASFSINAPDHWIAMIYVDNITDERGAIFEGLIPEWTARIRPQTVGLQLDYNF